MESKNELGGQMITKFFSILEYMSKTKSPIRLQDISTHLEIPQATMLRYLTSMIRQGYVYQDKETLRYALTWKICRITNNLSSPLSAKAIVSPYVYELSSKLSVGAAAMMIQGYNGVYIEMIDEPSTLLTSILRMSNCPPLNSTASGKLLLSQFSPAELDDFIQIRGLEQRTAHTIMDRARLEEELEAARKQGYALEVRECYDDVECVAVPVYDYNDKIYLALSVFGKSHLTEQSCLKNELLPVLFGAAAEISCRLGCSEKMLNKLRSSAAPSELPDSL